MFGRTIFGIVVILPRLVSSTLLTFGDLTLMPLSPRRRLKYRFLIESRAANVLLFFFSSFPRPFPSLPRGPRRGAPRVWWSGCPRGFFSWVWARRAPPIDKETQRA